MGTIILHKGKRIDTGEEVTGYLVKMMGHHHIIMPDDENTAYPVKEESIEPDKTTQDSSVPQPDNRWYVNKEMLPRLQNTVLICKGWYDKDKYQDVYDALRAYWANIGGLMIEDVCYDHILNTLLLPACEAFLHKRQFCEIFYEKMFKQDIVFHNFQNKMKKDKDTECQPLTAEYLVDTLINALFKLSRDEFFDDRDLQSGFHVI